jgi:hypothetical protein
MDVFLENATNESFIDHSIFQLDIMANVSMMDSFNNGKCYSLVENKTNEEVTNKLEHEPSKALHNSKSLP